MVRFKLTRPNQEPVTFTLTEDQSLSIGRSSKSDVQIQSTNISGMHCRITLFPTHLEVWDLDSTNGTLINGTKIIKKRAYLYDKIQIGDHILQFDIDSMGGVEKQNYLTKSEHVEAVEFEGSISRLFRIGGSASRVKKQRFNKGGRKSLQINYVEPEENKNKYSHYIIFLLVVQMIIFFVYDPKFYENYETPELVALAVLIICEYFILNKILTPKSYDVFIDKE